MMPRSSKIKAMAREALAEKYGTMIAAFVLSWLIRGLCAVLTLAALIFATGHPVSKTVIRLFRGNTAISMQDLELSSTGKTICWIAFLLLLVFTFVTSVWLEFGRKKLVLDLCRGKNANVSAILYCFRKGTHPWRIVGVHILTAFFVSLNWGFPVIMYLITMAAGHAGEVFREPTGWSIAMAAVLVLTELWMVILSLGLTFADAVILDQPETGVMDALEASWTMMRGKRLKLFWTCSLSFILWIVLMNVAPVTSLWIIPYMEAAMMMFYLCAKGEGTDLPVYRLLYLKPSPAVSPAPAETPAEISAETAIAPVMPVEPAIPEVSQKAEETCGNETADQETAVCAEPVNKEETV